MSAHHKECSQDSGEQACESNRRCSHVEASASASAATAASVASSVFSVDSPASAGVLSSGATGAVSELPCSCITLSQASASTFFSARKWYSFRSLLRTRGVQGYGDLGHASGQVHRWDSLPRVRAPGPSEYLASASPVFQGALVESDERKVGVLLCGGPFGSRSSLSNRLHHGGELAQGHGKVLARRATDLGVLGRLPPGDLALLRSETVGRKLAQTETANHPWV